MLEAPKQQTGRAQSLGSEGVASPWTGLLPQEIFFGLFLLVTWLRLVFAAGLFCGDCLLYLGLIAAGIAAGWFSRSSDSSLRCRLGMLYYPLAMNVVFANMRSAVPKIHPQS